MAIVQGTFAQSVERALRGVRFAREVLPAGRPALRSVGERPPPWAYVWDVRHLPSQLSDGVYPVLEIFDCHHSPAFDSLSIRVGRETTEPGLFFIEGHLHIADLGDRCICSSSRDDLERLYCEPTNRRRHP